MAVQRGLRGQPVGTHWAAITEYFSRVRLGKLAKALNLPVSELERMPARTVEEYLTISETVTDYQAELAKRQT